MDDSEPVVFLRNSERKSYLTCRQQWWWAYVDCLTSKETRSALRMGDLVHQALARWYKKGRRRGQHPAKTYNILYNEQLEQGLGEFTAGDGEDARELGIDMLKHYVDVYGTDDHIEVICPEMPFQIAVRDKHGRPMHVQTRDGRMARLVQVGEGDVIIRDLTTNQIGMMEHKTAAAISIRHLSLDEQAGTYWTFFPMFLAAKGILDLGQDLDFIQYNFLRKAMRDTRPQDELGRYLNKPTAKEKKEFGENYPGSISKNQPPPYFLRHKVYRDKEDRNQILYRVRAEAWEMDLVRQGKLPVYKNPSSAYPDQHCAGCEFFDMCELHETGSNWEELRDLTMTTWDPYAAHREGDQ